MAETLLTRQHHGQTIAVAVGSQLVVQLDESPTTGYTWAPVQANAALPLTGDGFTAAAPGRVGGGGQRRLHFDVVQPGEHRLELALMRPWEGAAAAVERFALTVQAQPP
jgi:predicted secreted protein